MRKYYGARAPSSKKSPRGAPILQINLGLAWESAVTKWRALRDQLPPEKTVQEFCSILIEVWTDAIKWNPIGVNR